MSDGAVRILDVTGGQLATQGFETNGFGIEYFKDDLFSESHNILQSFLYNPPAYDFTWNVEFVMDHDATEHPDVYEAWTTAGGDSEVLPTIAKLPELGKWGVGFGGKKNGERAAKLALAASIAMDSEMTPQIVYEYPSFGELLQHASGYEGGGGDDGGYGGGYDGGGSKGKGKGKGGGKGKGKGKVTRASPYGDAGYGGGGFEDGGWDGGEEDGGLVELLKGKLGGKGKSKGKIAALLSQLEGGGKGWGADGGDGWGDGGDGGGDGWSGGGKGKGKGKAKGDGWSDGGDAWSGGGKGKGKGGGKESKGPNLKSLPAENKVWVGSLPQGTTAKTLEEHFALTGGTVVGVNMLKNGTAAVAYQSAAEATQAIGLLNMSDMGGQAIEVDKWTSW